jgi:hypothetical protein
MNVMKTKNYLSRKTLFTVFALALAGMIALAQDYYRIYKDGVETIRIPGSAIDSVKVEDDKLNFYGNDALLYAQPWNGVDSLTVAALEDNAIRLLSPVRDAAIDLNSKSSLSFFWSPIAGVEAYTLKLATAEDMSDAKSIYLGNNSYKTLTADEMYDYLSLLNIEYNLTDLYWTVEDTDGNVAAAAPSKFQVRKKPKGILSKVVGLGDANTTPSFIEGKLIEGKAWARVVCVDTDNNIFAFVRDGDLRLLALISEARDTVEKKTNTTYATTATAIDKSTGIVYAIGDHCGTLGSARYLKYDPANNYAEEDVTITLPTTDQGTARSNGTAIACHDGYLYLRYSLGKYLYKVHLSTGAISVASEVTDAATCMAINPLQPNLLYYAYSSKVYTVDLTKAVDDATAKTEIVGSGPGLNTVTGICFDAKGNAYLVERNNQRAIWMITSDGALIKVIGNGAGYVEGGQATAKMTTPSSIDIGGNGCLYVTTHVNTGYVWKYTPHVPSEE